MALREFSSVKVGDELPEKTIPLTRQDLVNYAGVSGDLNPIHWDDEIAKVVGLDTAIAHGISAGSRVRRCATTSAAQTRLLPLFHTSVAGQEVLLAELGIERRQRLVEEQHFWLGGERPRQRHALLLSP